MFSRRSLISRQQRDAPSPIQRPHPSEAQPRQVPALPPYEPPTCPLTETAKRSLIDLNNDYRKYEKHIQIAIQNITECAAESNDKLYESKESLRKLVERREAAEDDQEKTEEEEEAEQRVKELEAKVGELTAQSEKALRDLIDYSHELAHQKQMMEDVTEAAAAASTMGMTSAAGNRKSGAGKLQREQANPSTSSDEDEEMDEVVDEANTTIPASILSLTELLKKAKEDYASEYNSKTMRAR
jgi:E3 SUMO-protein ligase NSE2